MKISSDKNGSCFLSILSLIIVVSFLIVGCGGGDEDDDGGGDGGNDVANIVIDSETSAEEITEVSLNDSNEVNLTTTNDSSLGRNLEVDSVVTVIPEADDRFPFGLSGKVSSVTTNPDGSVTATLEEATLADVFYSSDQNESVVLNADNFIGAISPTATQATEAASASYNSIYSASHGGTKYAINGGVVVRNINNSVVFSEEVAPSDIINLGEVELNLSVALADMGIDVSEIDDAEFIITGALENLVLDYVVDFNLTSGLNELKAIVRGDIDIDVKLSASGSATFGYYSTAWDEVEDAQADLLGISGKLTGLDSKDKVGKFPLVGLVWSVPCSTTCATALGDTRTPVNLAKLGGVIIWVYLDEKGTLTLEGDIGARVNSAEFSVGLEKPVDGELDVVYNLTNDEEERLLELPYIDGNVSLEVSSGVALDIDIFALGVRMANASAKLIGKYTTEFDGDLSYGCDSLGEDWSWEGYACIYTNYGAGLILSASFNAGMEINAGIFNYDSSFSYYGQWPSDDEMNIPGWHGIGDITWYTADGSEICFDSRDEDEDGYTVEQGDCDDNDANTFPGAAEHESTTDCMTDADDDGYGSDNPAGGAIAGTDENDDDNAINPRATEVCNDEKDNDQDDYTDCDDSDCDGNQACVSAGGLIAYWSFDNESDPTHDDSGAGNDLINYGAEWTSDGIGGGAMSFIGSNSYMESSNSLSFDMTEDRTFCAWAKLNSIDTGRGIVMVASSYTDDPDPTAGMLLNHSHDLGLAGVFAFYSVGENRTGDIILNNGNTIDLDNWYHLCAVVDDNVSELYINGSSGNTFTNRDEPTTGTVIGKALLGRHFYNVQWKYLDGLIDEVRIYDRALSEYDVQNLYEQGGGCFSFPFEEYFNNQDLPGWEQAYGSDVIWEDSADGGEITSSSTGARIDHCFEEINTIPVYFGGRVRLEQNLSGNASDYISIQLLRENYADFYSIAYGIYSDENNVEFRLLRGDGVNNPTILLTTNVPFDTDYHDVYAYRNASGEWHIEFDGNQVGGTTTETFYTEFAHVQPGFNNNGGYITKLEAGYTTDIESDLIAYYPFNGNANDESGNGNHGTVNGATLSSDRFADSDSAYSFDGVDDYIEIESPSILINTQQYDYTIAGWFKPMSNNVEGYFILMCDEIDGVDHCGPIIYWRNGRIAFQAGVANSGIDGPYMDGINLDQWYHVIGITYKNGTLKLYINGVQVDAGSFPTHVDTNMSLFRLAGNDNYNRYVNCQLDDIRLYNRALSEAEIQELYNQN